MSDQVVLRCERINRVYRSGPQELHILRDIDLQVTAGERIAIVGASGSGKSTLLHCMGGLDELSSGRLLLDGRDYFALGSAARAQLRNRYFGFVYQFHHLLPEFSALENVAMPLLLGGAGRHQARQEAAEMLTRVGLQQRMTHKPSELSGGERQRAAIARAMVNRPVCLLADEPTGNLDSHTADQVFELMLSVNQDSATALVMVTHDMQLAARFDRCLAMQDGQLVSV